MSTGAIIGGVLFLMLLVIGVVVFFMMMGGDGVKTPGPGPGPAPAPAPAPIPYITVDESHLSEYKAGTVEMGAGSSAEDCRKLAYDADYASFGWRKAGNTCWANIDGEATAGKVAPLADHLVGCVARGEDINEGCKTTKTNVIRARHYKGYTSFEDIACNSIDSCRAAAKAKGANHFGWREAGGNGWVVTAPVISSTTPEFLINHTIGCTDPTKRPPNC